MERAVDILLGVLAGLLVGLVTVVLGTVGGMPLNTPDAPGRCVGLMAAPPVVGALCGGWVAWRLGRSGPAERQPERLRLRRRR